MTMIYLAIGMAALAYLGLPLMIKSTLRINSRPGMNPASDGHLRTEVQEYFSHVSPGLQQLGFERASVFTVEGSTPNTRPHVSLWVNRSKSQWAAANVIIATQGDKPPKIVRYVEFVTKLEGMDGHSVTTGNSAQLGAFKKVPGSDTLHAPRLTDPANLYKLHQWRESRFLNSAKKRFIPERGQEMTTYADLFEQSIKRQVEAGYLETSANDPTIYTPTVVGAYMMTWAQLPPMKGMKQSAQQKRAEDQIRDAAKAAGAAPMRRAA